jgi:hypothetical protein
MDATSPGSLKMSMRVQSRKIGCNAPGTIENVSGVQNVKIKRNTPRIVKNASGSAKYKNWMQHHRDRRK